MPAHAIPVFTAMTLLFSWGIVGFYVLGLGLASGWFGDISGSPAIFFLAVWAPPIAWILLVLSLADAARLRLFLSQLVFRWAPLGWVILKEAKAVDDNSDHVAAMEAALAGLDMKEPQ